VNGHKTDVPSFLVKEGDKLGWREGSRKSEYYKTLVENIQGKTVLSWLSLDRQNLEGQVLSMPTPEQIGATFDAKAITEYYSR